MLSKRISQSKKVNSLQIKSQIVWTWTIPYLDDYGCYTGDSEDIKTEVFPKNKKISQKDIEICLGFDLAGIADRPEIDSIRTLHETLKSEYGSDDDQVAA